MQSHASARYSVALVPRTNATLYKPVQVRDRDGISVKNSTDEYFSPKIAHKTRIELSGFKAF